MSKVLRKIISIDEEKCDGCGQCIPACEEGALMIVDGKARLVKEIYCDGLGDCLGECPQGAITMIEREAAPFDEAAVEEHLKNLEQVEQQDAKKELKMSSLPVAEPGFKAPIAEEAPVTEENEAELSHWPVQIHLVAPQSNFLKNADLLIAADCVPFAYANFHRQFLAGRSLLIGCPKLDDVEAYHHKLVEIFKLNKPNSITVVMMEIGCCAGMSRLVQAAIKEAGIRVPYLEITVNVDGTIKED